MNFKGIFLVSSGFFCLKEPDAAFLGLANFSLNLSKSLFLIKTSPLISISLGKFLYTPSINQIKKQTTNIRIELNAFLLNKNASRYHRSWNPSDLFSPDVGLSRSPQICSKVDFPLPDGPTNATLPPGGMRSVRALTPPPMPTRRPPPPPPPSVLESLCSATESVLVVVRAALDQVPRAL